MNLKSINSGKKSKFTCIKNHCLSIKITEFDNQYYVKSKSEAFKDLEIVTTHITEEDAYRQAVSYLLGHALYKVEKMNIVQLKEMVEYLLLI